jgi:hypothetical protein
MSIHVCKCHVHGADEYHLRYPGMTPEVAQRLANEINSGNIEKYYRAMELLKQVCELHTGEWQPMDEDLIKFYAKLEAFINPRIGL